MEKVLIYLGPLPIYKFGLTMALGILAGFWVINREARRNNLDPDRILTLAMLVILGGIIGARLFYILAYAPGYYLQHPIDILKIYEGGLSIHGGIIGAVVAGWWYVRRCQLNFWLTADILVLGTILGQAIGRIGCDVFGVPMAHSWPWGVTVGGILLHPVQIYETVLDLTLFLILWGKRSALKYQGQLFVSYLFGYALIRFIIEFFRENPLILGPLTPAHLTSILFMVIAIVLYIYLSNTNRIEVWPGGWQVSRKVWSGVVLLALAASGIFYWLNSLI